MKSSLATNTLISFLTISITSLVYAQPILSLKDLLLDNQVDEKLLQKTYFKTEEIQAQKELVRANLLPQLSANIKKEYAKSQVPSQEARSPQEFSLNFSTPIFDGKNLYQFRKGQLQREGRNFDEEIEKQKLLKDLSLAFIDYYEAKNILDITENNIKVLEKYEQATTDRLKLGDSTTLELQKVQSRLYSAQAEFITSQADYQNKKNVFYGLWNIELNSEEKLSLLSKKELEAISNLDLKPQLYEIRSIEKKIDAQTQTVLSTKLAHFPTLSLIASYLNVEPNNFQYNDKETSYKVGVQLNIPLYTGGETIANTRIAVAQKEQLIRDLYIISKGKDLESVRLKNDFRRSIDSLELQEKAQTANNNVLKLFNRELKGSIRTTFDVLNAMDDLYKSEISLTKNYCYANKKLIEFLHGYGYLNYEFFRTNLK